MSKNLVLTIFLFQLCVSALQGQDVLYSQYFSSQAFMNPALTGDFRQPRFTLHYRNHVPAQSAAFVTYSADYDQHVEFLKGGLGFHLMLDQAGDYQYFFAGASHAYGVKLSKNIHLKAGIQYDFVQASLNIPDPVFAEIQEDIVDGDTKTNIDFTAGLLVYDETKFLGIKIAHLHEPDLSSHTRKEDVYEPERSYEIQGGMSFQVNQHQLRRYEIEIKPFLVFRHQESSNLILAGSSFDISHFSGGILLRNSLSSGIQSLVLLFGMHFKSYKLAYSYDWNVMKYSYANFGAHEISFQYFFETSGRKNQYKAINCPSF